MLAQREYKKRHDNIARNIHWELCGELDVDRANKWYEHQPEGVSRKGNTKILWDCKPGFHMIVAVGDASRPVGSGGARAPPIISRDYFVNLRLFS